MKTEIYKNKEDIKKAAEFIKEGELVAMPTETVYGLAADTFNEKAIKKIFEAKGRPQDNPLIVHISKTEDLYKLAKEVPEKALKLAEKFWPGPLTMILPKKDSIPDIVSASLPTVAIRMPSHPMARALIEASGVPLAAPSANISGFPSPTTVQYVIDDMNGRIAAIIDGGDCGYGIESTVVTLASDPPKLLRPGAITHSQLEEVLGKVEIDKAVLHPLEKGAVVSSPGMKYKHYSPKAEIYIVRGNKDDFISYVKEHKKDADYIMCFEGEESEMPLPAVTFGTEKDSLSQARRLFDALRELDENGAHKVFARAPSEKGVGLGVCNRLYRSAAFRFLNVKKGKIIGLTGESGSGKSRAAKIFAENSCVIIDADAVYNEILLKKPDIIKEIASVFGNSIINDDNTLNRRELAAKAFSSYENKKKLDEITHPPIVKECKDRAEKASAEGRTVIIDAPLLFTSGLDKICDITVKLYAPETVRLARIIKRDGISEYEAVMRFSKQTEEAKLSNNADFSINNYEPYVLETEIIKFLDNINKR